MILVVLGTWGMPFARPLAEIEGLLASGRLTGPVLVQCGHTNFATSRMTLTPFFERDVLERQYEEASLVICQAGVGSIMLGLRKGRKVIAIARRRQFDEHIDDHQTEILDVFSKSGFILPWAGTGDLAEVLDRAADFTPARYPFGEERISAAILDYLEAAVPR